MAFIDAVQLNDFHAPAANTLATKTIAAVVDHYHVIDSIHCGYDAATGGSETVVVVIGATTFERPLSNAAGVYEFLFPRGHYKATRNQAMTVALTAPAGGAKGAINFTYRTVHV